MFKLLIPIFLIFAAEPPLYSQRFESLRDFSHYSTQNLQSKNSVWVFFQNNCTSCEKQLRNLKCLDSSAISVALGYGSQKQVLAKVIQKTQFKGEAVMVPESFTKELSIRQTPTIFIVNAQGQVTFKKEHAVPCEGLLKEIKRLN